MTFPACQKCNNDYSFDENVVRAILTLVSTHPHLVSECKPNGRLSRALARDKRLQGVLARSRQPDGNYGLTDEIMRAFQRVFCKTAQGLFFGLYERLVPKDQLHLIRVENRRLMSPDDLILELRPSPLQDITDKPLSAISPNSWHTREPIYIMELQPVNGGPPVRRVFHLTRETPAEWGMFQDGIFQYTFIKREEGGIVCVLNLWKTLLIAVAAPWPDGRGPIRRGKKNPLSRDNQ